MNSTPLTVNRYFIAEILLLEVVDEMNIDVGAMSISSNAVEVLVIVCFV